MMYLTAGSMNKRGREDEQSRDANGGANAQVGRDIHGTQYTLLHSNKMREEVIVCVSQTITLWMLTRYRITSCVNSYLLSSLLSEQNLPNCEGHKERRNKGRHTTEVRLSYSLIRHC